MLNTLHYDPTMIWQLFFAGHMCTCSITRMGMQKHTGDHFLVPFAKEDSAAKTIPLHTRTSFRIWRERWDGRFVRYVHKWQANFSYCWRYVQCCLSRHHSVIDSLAAPSVLTHPVTDWTEVSKTVSYRRRGNFYTAFNLTLLNTVKLKTTTILCVCTCIRI